MFRNCIECVVCKAAGKSDNIDHWIRNDKGAVVCPTLLEQNCRHCGQKGHTPKYCIIKKQEERQDRRATFRSLVVAAAAEDKKKKNKISNAFGALDESSDEEVENVVVAEKMTKEEMRQALCEVLGIRNAAIKEAVKKPQQIPVKRRLWSEMLEDSDSEDDEQVF